MRWLGEDRLYVELVLQTAALADAVCVADRAMPVPTCPEWTIVDQALLAHWLANGVFV